MRNNPYVIHNLKNDWGRGATEAQNDQWSQTIKQNQEQNIAIWYQTMYENVERLVTRLYREFGGKYKGKPKQHRAESDKPIICSSPTDAGTPLSPPLLSPEVPSFRGGYDITVPWGIAHHLFTYCVTACHTLAWCHNRSNRHTLAPFFQKAQWLCKNTSFFCLLLEKLLWNLPCLHM